MICKIDHKAIEAIPRRWCRACNPQLETTPDARAALDARDRAREKAEQANRTRQREIARAETKLASLVKHGEPAASTVNGKIAASMRKKIKRLTLTLGEDQK